MGCSGIHIHRYFFQDILIIACKQDKTKKGNEVGWGDNYKQGFVISAHPVAGMPDWAKYVAFYLKNQFSQGFIFFHKILFLHPEIWKDDLGLLKYS